MIVGEYLHLNQRATSSKEILRPCQRLYRMPPFLFFVAQKNTLFTDWIMTGEGPKGIKDCHSTNDELLAGYIAEWIKE